MVAPLIIALVLLAIPPGVDLVAGDQIDASMPLLFGLERAGEVITTSKLARVEERLMELDVVRDKDPAIVERQAKALNAAILMVPNEVQERAIAHRDRVLSDVLARAPESAKRGLQNAMTRGIPT